MIKTIAAAIACCVFVTIATGARADEPAGAQALLEKSCDTCHKQLFGGKADGAYTRANRRVTSKQVLMDQIKLWNSSAGAKWSGADMELVAQYLNDAYYKLP